MKTILKYLDVGAKLIFQKQVLLFGLPSVGIMLFHKPLEQLVSSTLVKHLLSQIHTGTFSDSVFILLAVLTVLLFVVRRSKYIVSANLSILYIILCLFYCYYRFVADNLWSFTTFSFNDKIKYADVVLIATLANSILFLKSLREKHFPENNSDSFFDDEPIGKDKTDELGYTDYAQSVASKVKSSYFEKAFAIGINGKWGTGKTSFIDLLKRNLKDDNLLVIDFNPWNSHTPKAIIKDFFETIQEALRPYHSSLTRLLIAYSNKLVSINSTAITRSIYTTITTLTGYDSVNTVFTDINDALKKIDKKIVIVIDDLDRLDKEEIVEVIRLIRNTANFHNTFFIVAYDRNYITQALQKYNPYNHERFLEKIFQIEITLPYVDTDIFRYKLAEKLKTAFPDSFHGEIEKAVIGSSLSYPSYLNTWLESIRDVTRLANALTLNLARLQGEVDLGDFIALEVLRLRYPAVYELLFKKTNVFFESSEKSNSKYMYQLKVYTQDEINGDDAKKNTRNQLRHHLHDNYSELSVPFTEIEKIVDLLDDLFGHGIYGYSSKSDLSVTYPSKFYRYFAYDLLKGNLSEVAFSKARMLDQQEFHDQILEWVKKGFQGELIDRFVQIKSFDDRADFEKVITAIFYLANLESKGGIMFRSNVVGYDVKYLSDRMSDYNGALTKTFYQGEEGGKALKLFVRGLFTSATSPFSFESHFLRYLNHHPSEVFPLTLEETKAIVLDYFRRYCDETDILDSYVWDLFHNCKYSKWHDLGNNTRRSEELIQDGANTIMQEFITETDLNGFILAIIEPERFEKKSFSISTFPETLYGSWDNFKNQLDQLDEEKWSYLPEFKQFYQLASEKGLKAYIEFDFKIIPIKEILRD